MQQCPRIFITHTDNGAEFRLLCLSIASAEAPCHLRLTTLSRTTKAFEKRLTLTLRVCRIPIRSTHPCCSGVAGRHNFQQRVKCNRMQVGGTLLEVGMWTDYAVIMLDENICFCTAKTQVRVIEPNHVAPSQILTAVLA